MEAHMRCNLLLAALLLTSPLAMAPVAQAHGDSYDARAAGPRANPRVEARQLRHAEAALRRTVKQARRDGVITRYERAAIRQAMERRDRIARQLRHQSRMRGNAW
jgi:uncharacterized membrane protein YebE (DUF533 family)